MLLNIVYGAIHIPAAKLQLIFDMCKDLAKKIVFYLCK
jgi:hypothetical protein